MRRDYSARALTHLYIVIATLLISAKLVVIVHDPMNIVSLLVGDDFVGPTLENKAGSINKAGCLCGVLIFPAKSKDYGFDGGVHGKHVDNSMRRAATTPNSPNTSVSSSSISISSNFLFYLDVCFSPQLPTARRLLISASRSNADIKGP